MNKYLKSFLQGVLMAWLSMLGLLLLIFGVYLIAKYPTIGVCVAISLFGGILGLIGSFCEEE